MALLHHLATERAEHAPDRPAIAGADSVTTYGMLLSRARSLAAGLHRIGVRPGDRVVIVAEQAPWYVEACLGVLHAGAVIVPHCADVKPDSFRWLLEHTEASAVILREADLPHAPPHVPPRLVVAGARDTTRMDRDVFCMEELIAAGGTPRNADLPETALASIFYTSGTTGRPKGVMLSHRNLVANVRSIVSYLGLGPDDRAAMALPFQYVYGNSVLHTHLAAGGSIGLVGSVAFPAKMVSLIQMLRCTNLPAVASSLCRLLDAGLSAQHALRFVTHAGGPMPSSLLARSRAALPSTRIVLMYGQTEASARLAWLPPDELPRRPGSAGKAIPGVTLRIVDEHGSTQPSGVIGEVVASGDNVMVGYWKDPVETARVLRAGGLHTGDIGRMDEDGYLYLVGRNAEMIKSGGHRIGPREVEEVVESLPGIAQCAVVGVPDDLLGERIVAWVVAADPQVTSERAVLQGCFEKLPRFKLPCRVLFIPELPRTAVGKLDRRTLAAWAADAAHASSQPRDPIP
ncbi:MAG TPA: class I adenylate-forming enzyme family protein [Polyangiaceae bacterium]|nr:class I adenylate-forming enzyme family protein [Polyangiaceae bacterium]